VEKELSDYYSDMFYKVMLSGKLGFAGKIAGHIVAHEELDGKGDRASIS